MDYLAMKNEKINPPRPAGAIGRNPKPSIKRSRSLSEPATADLSHGENLRLFGLSGFNEPWRPKGCLAVGQTAALFWKVTITGKTSQVRTSNLTMLEPGLSRGRHSDCSNILDPDQIELLDGWRAVRKALGVLICSSSTDFYVRPADLRVSKSEIAKKNEIK